MAGKITFCPQRYGQLHDTVGTHADQQGKGFSDRQFSRHNEKMMIDGASVKGQLVAQRVVVNDVLAIGQIDADVIQRGIGNFQQVLLLGPVFIADINTKPPDTTVNPVIDGAAVRLLPVYVSTE